MQLQPPTERVHGNRLGPLIVVGAVVLGIGVLVAKPWDAPAGSSVALASATPSSPTVRVTASPAPTPADSPRPLPTPDIAPLGAIGTVTWAVVGDQPSVHCIYSRSVRGARHLARVEVQPPLISFDNPRSEVRDIRSLAWEFELQANRSEDVFDTDWQTVARSGQQLTGAADGRPANFSPMAIDYNARLQPRSAVFRVKVIAEWYTRNVELAGRAALVMDQYQVARDKKIGEWPVYCDGVRPAR